MTNLRTFEERVPPQNHHTLRFLTPEQPKDSHTHKSHQCYTVVAGRNLLDSQKHIKRIFNGICINKPRGPNKIWFVEEGKKLERGDDVKTKGLQQKEDHTEENARHWKRDLNSTAFKI